jgi:twinkle protein
MEINGFEIDEYNVHGIKQGATASTCPLCSKDRTKNKSQKCMSVNWELGIGHCNHCGNKVQLHTFKKKRELKTYLRPEPRIEEAFIPEVVAKHSETERGISKATLDVMGIRVSKQWMPKAQKEVVVMEFPYKFDGQLVNVKYRGPNKDFKFEKGCELIMYNLDAILHEESCVIVEGEWDALAYVEAGVNNVTSVPNGFTLPRPDGSSSINLQYLDNYYHYFENKERIYLAVDNDEPGNHGKQELVRRFGMEKCWLVDFKDCKDANDYLVKYGKEALAQTIQDATQYPLENIQTLDDFEHDLENFYINGSPKGYTTGMEALDNIYSIEPGQYTIITGPPSSGKSEFVDSICLGYALRYGMKTAFASPENKPNYLHADKIIRKVLGYRPKNEQHIKSSSFKASKDFYRDNFLHVEFEDGYDLHKILGKFEELVKRKGVRVFVIDPYNKTRLKASANKQVNDYTSDYLNEIDMFVKRTKSIVYLVAHPVKMKKIEGTNTYQMPDAYDIKGGGEMFDMAYHILGVVRDMDMDYVKLKTLKVKFQHLGKGGEEVYFKWNYNNGRYESIYFDPKVDAVPIPNWNNDCFVVGNTLDGEVKVKDSYSRIESFESNQLAMAIENNDAPF